MLKKLVFMALFLPKKTDLMAQIDSLKLKKFLGQVEIYTNSRIGNYYPIQTAENLSINSTFFYFQAKVKYKLNYFGRFTFDQYRLNYVDIGNNTKIDYKLKILNFGLDAGYSFDINKKISLLTYIGLGYAMVDVPNVNYNTATKIVDISSIYKSFLTYRGGIGFDYKINKLIIISSDFQYLNIPLKTNFNNKNLTGISYQIGIKTQLK